MCQNTYKLAHHLLIVCAILLIMPATGSAAEVQALPGDVPVIFRGKIGDDSTFVKRFGLIASVGVPELIFRPTDLLRTDGKEQIGRQQIALTTTAKLDLAPNTPKDVEIKITGIKLPGTYKGTLSFLRLEQGLNAALEVPIEVFAEGVPKLTPRKGSEAVKIQLFDCARSDCWIARLFQPGAFSSAYPLMFDNASLEEFVMTATVNAAGDATHGSLENVLRVESPVQVPVQSVFTLPIKIGDSNLLPDHYIGDVQLRMAIDAPPMKIPLEVNVRTGPIWPVIILLLGILFGRLLKYMKDKGNSQADLLLGFYRLETSIASSPEAILLQPMLEPVKTLIYDMKLDDAKTELKNIENRWTQLKTLQGLESSLRPMAGEPNVVTILGNIEETRNLIKSKQDQSASAMLSNIQAAVQDLQPPQAYAKAHAMAVEQAKRAVIDATRTVQSIAETPAGVGTVRFVTGIDSGLLAEVTLRVLRPAIWGLLFAALLVLGMQQLYMKNATFGSDPFSDYFGLVVWAMSSDVASRTLASLKPGS